jgi:hypothetical protein
LRKTAAKFEITAIHILLEHLTHKLLITKSQKYEKSQTFESEASYRGTLHGATDVCNTSSQEVQKLRSSKFSKSSEAEKFQVLKKLVEKL